MQTSSAINGRIRSERLIAGTLITIAISLIGLYVVKWSPYYAKAFSAAVHHTLGASILTGSGTAAPVVGWSAAWQYARLYYLAIWQALVLALVLGACLQVLIPRVWIARRLGTLGFGSSAIAGSISIIGMMCTCCTAPVVVSLRKQRASAGAAMAVFVATPALNPAVLIFIGYVLSWQLAAIRLFAGLAIVTIAAWLANVLTREGDAVTARPLVPAAIEDPNVSVIGVLLAWAAALWWEVRTILPGYIVIVFVLGALRAWLFPTGILLHGSGITATVVAAIAGTVFVIPTGAEVPIVQSLIASGLGVAPSTALLVALPAISAPSIFIVRSAFRVSLLAAVAAVVALGAIAAGAVAVAMHLAVRG